MKSIILLHGALGAQDQLSPLSEELSKLNYEIHLFTFSGHGQTPFQQDFNIKQFASELELFMRNNHIESPGIFGYSMGGYVALYLASQKKDMIAGIITLGTKFNWSPVIAQKEIAQLDAQVIMDKIPKFAEALKKRHGEQWTLLLKRTAEMMLSLGNNNIIDEYFSEIDTKVLIGLADKDAMVSVEETDHAAKCITNSSRFTLSNAKHSIETTDPKVLADIIHRFLH